MQFLEGQVQSPGEWSAQPHLGASAAEDDILAAMKRAADAISGRGISTVRDERLAQNWGIRISDNAFSEAPLGQAIMSTPRTGPLASLIEGLRYSD